MLYHITKIIPFPYAKGGVLIIALRHTGFIIILLYISFLTAHVFSYCTCIFLLYIHYFSVINLAIADTAAKSTPATGHRIHVISQRIVQKLQPR